MSDENLKMLNELDKAYSNSSVLVKVPLVSGDAKEAIAEIRNGNERQRNKIVQFFIIFIGAQFVVFILMLVLITLLVSVNMITTSFYTAIFNTLKWYIGAIVVEIVTFFGMVIKYYFNKKSLAL